MIDRVENSIREAFRKLNGCDGDLFECPIEEHAEYDSRKLHEVCINHRLAIYLGEYLLPELADENEIFYTDIELTEKELILKTCDMMGKRKELGQI